jgi:hypothetical protein
MCAREFKSHGRFMLHLITALNEASFGLLFLQVQLCSVNFCLDQVNLLVSGSTDHCKQLIFNATEMCELLLTSTTGKD